MTSLLLPGPSKAKEKAHRIVCINNTKQLDNGSLLYAGDFRDATTPNFWDGNAGDDAGSLPRSWVAGNAREPTATNIQREVQWPYNPAPGSYHCPSGQGATTEEVPDLQRFQRGVPDP